jgi:electron transport complex protein RnfG
MGNIFKPALVLLIVCLIVTAALAFTYQGTKETIAERARIDAENSRREILSNAEAFEPVDGIEALTGGRPELEPVREAYKGLKGASVVGYVFTVMSKGYGGDVEMMIGIDESGKITDVKITSHSETPGLGSKAADQPFDSQLSGFVPSQPLEVVKRESSKPEEVEAISGATITSRAVVKGVQAAVDIWTVLEGSGGDL